MKRKEFILLIVVFVLLALLTSGKTYAYCGYCEDLNICNYTALCDDTQEEDTEYVGTGNPYWQCDSSQSTYCDQWTGSLICFKAYDCWDFCDHKARNENNDKPNQACGTD